MLSPLDWEVFTFLNGDDERLTFSQKQTEMFLRAVFTSVCGQSWALFTSHLTFVWWLCCGRSHSTLCLWQRLLGFRVRVPATAMRTLTIGHMTLVSYRSAGSRDVWDCGPGPGQQPAPEDGGLADGSLRLQEGPDRRDQPGPADLRGR